MACDAQVQPSHLLPGACLCLPAKRAQEALARVEQSDASRRVAEDQLKSRVASLRAELDALKRQQQQQQQQQQAAPVHPLPAVPSLLPKRSQRR